MFDGDLQEDNVFSLCSQSISVLTSRYKDNKYALARILKHCLYTLPNTIDNQVAEKDVRDERRATLTMLGETYVSEFLNNEVQYYYFANSNTYVEYDGISFSVTSEDSISQKVLQTLSGDHPLAAWKRKIKANVLHQIKERGTSNVIPSSETIQIVLKSLYPLVFETRDEAKYFLTIIGDCLAKKNTHLCYSLPARARGFIEYIIHNLVVYTGFVTMNLASSIKYDYLHSDSDVSNCRVLAVNGSGQQLEYNRTNPLDLLFVAKYYSNRYDNAEIFLSHLPSSSKAQHALVLQQLGDLASIMSWFLDNTVEYTSSTDDSVSGYSLGFAWKRFCQKRKIPVLVRPDELMSTIADCAILLPSNNITRIVRDGVDDDSNLNYVMINARLNNSHTLPVSHFLRFWNETMKSKSHARSPSAVQDAATATTSTSNDSEEMDEEWQLEIDEIIALYGLWLRQNDLSTTTHAPLEDSETVAIIKYYLPELEITDRKYIDRVKCTLWDKKNSIIHFIEDFVKLKQQQNEPLADNFQIHNNRHLLYNAYSNYANRIGPCVASKHYFDRILVSHFIV